MTTFAKNTLEHDTKMVIFLDNQNHPKKEIYIYLQDLNEDGEIFFNVDYEINNQDGSFQNGNALENLNDILEAYGFEDYKRLSEYFRNMFGDDSDAFHKIIEDINGKGVRMLVDESEGFVGSCDGFAMWG